MSKTWAVEPPYPSWRDYSVWIADYYAERVADPAHSLGLGVEFSGWFGQTLPLLEHDPRRREDNTIVAKELLPLFEREPGAWRCVRFLHSAPWTEAATLRAFMHGWASVCPPELRTVVESIATHLAP
jgi:hypothetical protein